MRVHLPALVALACSLPSSCAQDREDASRKFLENDGGAINSARNKEIGSTKDQRMALGARRWDSVPVILGGEEPENIPPIYDPLSDAKCFNRPYAPSSSTIVMREVYKKYKNGFDWGFENAMGKPLQSSSSINNHVTNNRFPGMCLRMAFHDNSIGKDSPLDFQEYIKAQMNYASATSPTWAGIRRYMETSGADASVLICPEERFHPNNNYDNTASRILYLLQKDFFGEGSSLKRSTQWSYSDLLHNCAVAAAIYLTEAPDTDDEIDQALGKYPFQLGRRDACYRTSEKPTVFALCGPTELLPSIRLPATDIYKWFVDRGMNAWQLMILMWTHTTMDNMAHNCPLKKLDCVPGIEDMSMLPRANSDSRYFLGAGDSVGYFDLLHDKTHHPSIDLTGPFVDLEQANCKFFRDLVGDAKAFLPWLPDDFGDGTGQIQLHWPLTVADCRLSTDQVELDIGLVDIAQANSIFFSMDKAEKLKFLMCTLGILSGKGIDKEADCLSQSPMFVDGAHGLFLSLGPYNDHKFGAVWE